ncbi:E3 ubiquitin-protein ligase DTX3L [Nothobranchius furzeri]|uniref:E3 ubiquitin-protein ligase n=3 Tax=Nothobranchius furzeri TaxID=105023 RepID=A0A1A7Z8U9_NOTFU|nr:E3 ubiquitin-protein ligase DTX3L [Nothobranchius furzeri]KAF7200799.1 E3 ubiquitin-protein ligase DTX3L-like [Nothobranchius furzeri]
MEFFRDIILTVDKRVFREHPAKRRSLIPYHFEEKHSCYKVRVTYEELEELEKALSDSRPTQGQSPQQYTVKVSAQVMDYIQQIWKEKLQKLQGISLKIEIYPDATHTSSALVMFRAQPGLSRPQCVRLDFVRQQFLTFYQRTASDLEVTSLRLGPHNLEDLKRKFPRLLFKPTSSKDTTVVGPFPYLNQLKRFLSPKSQSFRKHPETSVPAGSAASKPSPSQDESCPICMETIKDEDKQTLRCKHSFCKDCLKTAFVYKPICPICGQLYGVLRGTQPEGGTMTVFTSSSPLPGCERHGTIVIQYHIPSGTQKEEHPNPGQPFVGVSRTAYLPDSSEGRKIVKLLRRAFDQRLTFTIGQSSTSGRNNTVTWNDIHHKTSTGGGPTLYGYPDPDYLSRVREELKVKGIE